MKRLLTALTIAASLSAVAMAQETLTLNRYLTMVEASNPDIQSINRGILSTGQKILELDMTYSPFLTGGYSYTDDKSGGSLGSTFSANESVINSWSLGLTKKFGFGSTLTVGYADVNAQLYGLMISTITMPHLSGNDIQPYVKFEQSLLREFGSGLTKQGILKSKEAARAAQYLQFYKKQQLLLRARSAYWTMALRREVVAFRQSSLDRTEKILRWNEKRVSLDLADKADLFQAQAGYKSRILALQTAQEDETRSGREFNTLIGKTGDTVQESLEKLSDVTSLYANLDELRKKGGRADVLAARAMYASSKYAEKETYYRSMPELSLTGTYSLHGLGVSNYNQGYTDAWDQVLRTDKPAYVIGLNFIVPLDYKTLSTVREGYRNDARGAKDSLASAELSAKNDWDQLALTWKNVKTRLALAREIQDIQAKRVANEQNRFERGRTTTFQLLTAEDDLDDATQSVLRLIYEELITAAQAELYNTTPSDLGGK